MTLLPIFSLSFWLNPNPPQFLLWTDRFLLVLVVACTVVGIVTAVIRSRPGFDKWMRRGLSKIAALMITMGLAGLLLYAFSYERIPYLSMRVWWIAWLLIVAVWVWFVARYFRIDIPAARKQRIEREQFEKWLPKNKK